MPKNGSVTLPSPASAAGLNRRGGIARVSFPSAPSASVCSALAGHFEWFQLRPQCPGARLIGGNPAKVTYSLLTLDPPMFPSSRKWI